MGVDYVILNKISTLYSNFYKAGAYMRDSEYIEIAKNYLIGCTSSLIYFFISFLFHSHLNCISFFFTIWFHFFFLYLILILFISKLHLILFFLLSNFYIFFSFLNLLYIILISLFSFFSNFQASRIWTLNCLQIPVSSTSGL